MRIVRMLFRHAVFTSYCITRRISAWSWRLHRPLASSPLLRTQIRNPGLLILHWWLVQSRCFWRRFWIFSASTRTKMTMEIIKSYSRLVNAIARIPSPEYYWLMSSKRVEALARCFKSLSTNLSLSVAPIEANRLKSRTRRLKSSSRRLKKKRKDLSRLAPPT